MRPAPFTLIIMICLVTSLPPISAEIAMGTARPVNLNASVDDAYEAPVRAATDGNGTWVATWRAMEHDLGCPNSGVAISRSADFGESWSPTQLLDPEGDTTFGPGDIVTDGSGNWLAVWITRNRDNGVGPDQDVGYARSTDNGLTWTDLAVLNSNATSDGNAEDSRPRAATDGTGTWIVTWFSKATLGGTIGSDEDILFVRSEDGGVSWSDPQPIVAAMASDSRHEQGGRVAAAGDTWIATWWSYPPGELVARILVSRSIDDGQTWSEPILISEDEVQQSYPNLATDGQGTWFVVWNTYEQGYDVNIVRSTDDGLTWSKPDPWNPNGLDGTDVGAPNLVFDGRGTWVASWTASGSVDGTFGDDGDVFVATSVDGGLEWSDPLPLNPWAGEDASLDTGAVVGPDGRGSWAALWTSRNTFGDNVGEDYDVFVTRFKVTLAQTCANDLDGDGYGSPGNPSCPFGAATDCDDGDLRISPGGRQICDGVNNDCDHPDWPALAGTNETDDDGDGRNECGGLECDDADDGIWGPPGEARDLMLGATEAGITTLHWSAPDRPGGTLDALRYDVLRTGGTFLCWPVLGEQECFESGIGPEPLAFESQDPGVGEVLFYQIRARNGCSWGQGSLGKALFWFYGYWTDVPRVGPDCP